MILVDASITNILTAGVAIGGSLGIAWATVRRQRNADSSEATVTAIHTWRELAESRAALLTERDGQILQLNQRLQHLETQVHSLTAEIAEMKRHDVSAAFAVLIALDAKVDIILAASNNGGATA